MTSETTKSTAAWDTAVHRATAVVHQDRPGGMEEDNGDTVAMVLHSLHTRSNPAVDTVPWSHVLWWLWDDEHVITLVENTLPGTAATVAGPGSGLTEQDHPTPARWQRQRQRQRQRHNRTWDPQAPLRRHSPPTASGDFLRQREALPDPAIVSNSSGVSHPSMSHRSGGFPRDRMLRSASPGVPESPDKRYSFETHWRLAV